MRAYAPNAWMRRAGLLTVAALAAHGLVPGPVAAVNSSAGGVPDRVVVSDDPADWTPHVLDGRIDAITQVGDRVVAGGRFSKVRQAGGKEILTRKNLFAFDARTGAIDRTFNPAPNDAVYALVAAPGGGAVFVGGKFDRIAGKAQPALAKVDVASGRLSDGFRPAVDSRVDALAVTGQRLFLAGEISSVNGAKRWGLAAVDVEGGAVEPGVAVKFSDPGNGVLTVNRIAIRPDGSRLVALGSFLKADGENRPRLAVLDLDGGNARLAGWHSEAYSDPCSSSFGPTYIRGVDVSADGSFFVVATTGGKAKALCDTVARFELGGNGHDIKPTWVDTSGGDSFTGVAVTDAAVYVGGHPRWLNNPYNNGTGKDAKPGIGSVPRPGIAALDPVNGLPLSWNPGREPRGLGVLAFLATPEGLWIGMDTDNVGGEYHPRVAFFPTKGGKVLDRPRPGQLPAVIYRAVSDSGVGLAEQTVDGNGAGTVRAPAGGSVGWSDARAAFAADGRVYVVSAEGRIDAHRIQPGGELGAADAIDLRGLDTLTKAKFPTKSLTGAAFDAEHGRLYYTISGDRRLYYRYFTPESGVVGGVPFTASGEGDDFDWDNVRGLMIADGHLYYATGDAGVSRIELPDGRPASDSPPPPAGAATTLTPEADARVESANPRQNFGSSSTLAADGAPATSSYLRFVVPSSVGEVARARLRLYVRDASRGGAVLFPAANDWTEKGLTYEGRPARTGPEAARTGAVSAGRWVEVDVTPLITGPGTVTFELTGANSDGVGFKSRNSSDKRPELVIEAATPAR
ncbi:MAG TPA: DNRLRE domain-containing protein [Acidimicrobiia bacterium]|nr:DNRLRE domain-containing protein [Acidimicrobiia bacterium]